MRVFAFVVVLCSIATIAAAQTYTDLKGDYLGQSPPSGDPVVFAPGTVSVDGRYEYGVGFSPRGDVLYFTAEYPAVEVVDVPGGHAFVSPDESFLLPDPLSRWPVDIL